MRLSEWLDRFRPAGSPGASSAPEMPTAGAPAELTDLLTAVRALEADAAAIIAAAVEQAESRRQQARERVHEREVARPAECAAARAAAHAERRRLLAPSVGDPARESVRTIAELEQTSAATRPALVAAVLALMNGHPSPSSSPTTGPSS